MGNNDDASRLLDASLQVELSVRVQIAAKTRQTWGRRRVGAKVPVSVSTVHLLHHRPHGRHTRTRIGAGFAQEAKREAGGDAKRLIGAPLLTATFAPLLYAYCYRSVITNPFRSAATIAQPGGLTAQAPRRSGW